MNILLQNFQSVFFSGENAAERCRIFFLRGKFSGTRVGRRFNNLYAWQIILDPATALRERLWMRVKFLDLRARRIAHQTLLHGQNDLRNDLQIAVHEHVERVGDHAFGGIFHRHDAIVRTVFADLGENIRDGFLRRVFQAGAEAFDRRLMRESGFRPEIRDAHRLFKRERAGHDFAVNGAELLVGHRAGIVAADAIEHGTFAMRRVDFLAGRQLDFADGEDVLRACVEQLDDLRVELVNRFAMFGETHFENEE